MIVLMQLIGAVVFAFLFVMGIGTVVTKVKDYNETKRKLKSEEKEESK